MPIIVLLVKPLVLHLISFLNLLTQWEEGGTKTYVDRLKQKLEWAFAKAQENIQKNMKARKKFHDKSLRCHKV